MRAPMRTKAGRPPADCGGSVAVNNKPRAGETRGSHERLQPKAWSLQLMAYFFTALACSSATAAWAAARRATGTRNGEQLT